MQNKFKGIPSSKLSLITEIWNYFILKFKYVQSEIKWNEETKTNYFGDLIHYLFDTFEILDRCRRKKTFENSIAILQIVYVQQDLLDELLYIFVDSQIKPV